MGEVFGAPRAIVNIWLLPNHSMGHVVCIFQSTDYGHMFSPGVKTF